MSAKNLEEWESLFGEEYHHLWMRDNGVGDPLSLSEKTKLEHLKTVLKNLMQSPISLSQEKQEVIREAKRLIKSLTKKSKYVK